MSECEFKRRYPNAAELYDNSKLKSDFVLVWDANGQKNFAFIELDGPYHFSVLKHFDVSISDSVLKTLNQYKNDRIKDDSGLPSLRLKYDKINRYDIEREVCLFAKDLLSGEFSNAAHKTDASYYKETKEAIAKYRTIAKEMAERINMPKKIMSELFDNAPTKDVAEEQNEMILRQNELILKQNEMILRQNAYSRLLEDVVQCEQNEAIESRQFA